MEIRNLSLEGFCPHRCGFRAPPDLGFGQLSVLNTLPETNSSPMKIGLPNRKVVFQPSIFRGYVSFREGSIYQSNHIKQHLLFFVYPIWKKIVTWIMIF